MLLRARVDRRVSRTPEVFAVGRGRDALLGALQQAATKRLALQLTREQPAAPLPLFLPGEIVLAAAAAPPSGTTRRTTTSEARSYRRLMHCSGGAGSPRGGGGGRPGDFQSEGKGATLCLSGGGLPFRATQPPGAPTDRLQWTVRAAPLWKSCWRPSPAPSGRWRQSCRWGSGRWAGRERGEEGGGCGGRGRRGQGRARRAWQFKAGSAAEPPSAVVWPRDGRAARAAVSRFEGSAGRRQRFPFPRLHPF